MERREPLDPLKRRRAGTFDRETDSLEALREGIERPYVAAGGVPVPLAEGIRRKAIYVDQVNGLDTNSGRTWALSKQTVFGGTGALASMADGDMMIIMAGHVEALTANQIISLNSIKILAEGPGKSFRHTSAPVTFSGAFTVTLSGARCDLVCIVFTCPLTVSGNRNYLKDCCASAALVVSGSSNYFDGLLFPGSLGGSVTISGSANFFERPIGNSTVAWAFAATASANVMMSVICLSTPWLSITFAAGSTGNSLFDVVPGHVQVTDSGTNFVQLRSVSSTESTLYERIYPEINAVAVPVTGGAVAGAWGAWTDIMGPGAAPVSDFDFLGIVSVLDMVDDYQIQFRDTSLATLGDFTLNCAVAATRFNAKLSIPIRVRTGVGVQARLRSAGGGSDTASLRIVYRV